MMKRFFTLLLSIMLLSGAIAALPDTAGLRRRYPDANMVLLDDTEYIRYNPDGSSVATDEFSYRILTEKGRDDLRKLNFSFHSSYEKVSVTALSVTKPDGRIIRLEPDKLSVITIDHSQMSVRIYDPNSRQLSITIPDLEVGDTLKVSVREENFKSRIPGQWSGFAVLQSNCPVLNYTYTIDAPADRPLRSIAVKNEVKGTLSFTETPRGDRIIYRWQAENVPQLIPEPGMPPLYSCAMRVLTGTAKNWSEIASWYAGLCAPKLAAVTPEMRAFVKQTIAGKKSDMEKITALFQYVSQRIRYTGITDEETAPGYEPHDVSRTFERGHGVCRDKAALLVSLLKLAGFEAHPVLFMSGYPKDEDVPNIYFNHAIVQVKGKDGQDILMDPTFETTTELLPAYLGNCSYLVATETPTTLKRSPVIPAENNLLEIDSCAEVSGNTLNGTITMNFKGIHDQMYRATFSEWKPEEVRRYFAGALRDIIPGAELETYTVTPANLRNMAEPLKVILKYTASDCTSSNLLSPLALPEFASRFGTIRNLFNALKLEKRRFPLEALPRAVSEKFTLKLPPAISINSIPPKVDLSVPGALRLSREITRNGQTLSGKNFFAVDTAEITPADYLKIKAALAGFESASKTLPLIETALTPAKSALDAASYPGADSLIISDDRTIKMHTANSWDDTRTVKRKIFTYGGAVQHSTVNIPYHPLMEDVTISGEFITPDGKKHILSANEINRLDAPWASAAKRYPAGKILTAAFPGVEPGSTVTYTITRKVKNRPYFYAEMPSRTTEPALRRQLEITPEDGLAHNWPPEIAVYKNSKTITASVQNCSRIIPEAFTPELEYCVPVFKIYSKNASGFARSLHDALKAKVVVTDNIRRLAARLPLVSDIHKFVTTNIVEAGPALNEVPWSAFYTPEETLKSGVGNSADRAILYAALCEAAKIKYNFIAVADAPYPDKPELNFNNYEKFDRIILKTASNDFLNDSDRYSTPCDLYSFNKITLDLASGKLIPRTHIAWRNTQLRLIDINIKADRSAEITVQEDNFDQLASNLRRKLSRATPEELKQFFQSRCAAISQAAILQDHRFTGKNAKIEYRFTVPDFVVPSGKYLIFELPYFSQYAEKVRLAGEKRNFPYLRETPGDFSTTYRISYPEKFRLISTAPALPPVQYYSDTAGPDTAFAYSQKVQSSAPQLTVRSELYLPFQTITPDQYHRLFKLNKLLNTPALRQIILEERRSK